MWSTQCPKVEYTKNAALDLEVLSTSAHSQEGCAGQGNTGTTAQQVPCFGDTPLHPWPRRATPEGLSVTVPVLGFLVLLHPDLSVSLCQLRILQQARNPDQVELSPSSLLLLPLLLGLLHQRAWGHCPIYLFLNLGWEKVQELPRCTPSGPRKASSLSRMCWMCRVPGLAPSFYRRDPDSSAPALPCPLQQHWPLTIPRAAPSSGHSGTYPHLYTTAFPSH